MRDQQQEQNHSQLMDRYKELCTDARYYDNKMWTLPTAAFSIMFVALKFIFELGGIQGITEMIGYKILLSVLNILIFCGFLFLFAKYHLHQLLTQEDITTLRYHLFCESLVVGSDGKSKKLNAKYTRQDGIPAYAPRVTKWFAPHSSTSFVLNLMVITLLCNIGVALWYIYLGVKQLQFVS